MRVIPPLTITDSIFTSSTCAEPASGEVAYAGGTTYGLGDQVIVVAEHRTYQSLSAGNIGHTPISSPTYWLDIGPTMKWKMMDLYRNTQTTHGTPLTVVLTPGVRTDSIGLLGLDGDTVTVSMTSSGTTVYSNTIDLNTRGAFNWFDYFFLPFDSLPSIVLFDLPAFTNGIITITIARASGSVSCGGLVLGSSQYLGKTKYGAVSEELNFSTVERDEFGNATLIPRRSVPKTNQTTELDKAYVNRVRVVRKLLNAVPALWSGVDDVDSEFFEALLILGVAKQFSINLAYTDAAIITLELEEV